MIRYDRQFQAYLNNEHAMQLLIWWLGVLEASESPKHAPCPVTCNVAALTCVLETGYEG
jgi:hypothetical protein